MKLQGRSSNFEFERVVTKTLFFSLVLSLKTSYVENLDKIHGEKPNRLMVNTFMGEMTSQYTKKCDKICFIAKLRLRQIFI